jgi:adenylate cyclase
VSGTGGALAVAGLVALAALLAALLAARRESRRLRGRLEDAARSLQDLQLAFGRFAPDEVVERVLESGISHDGRRCEVTALFCDLVGFTALSEKLEPSVLVRVLNGYFERMSEAIEAHRGHVSTFLGDGILALFGALAPNPWQANDAVHAALAMREALRTYNRELEAEGLPPLAIGIGLQRGTGVAGLVGSRRLKEFAVVGRIVNVAARVQELTREHDADVIVTDAVARGLDPRLALRALPPARLKGVSEPVRVHAVLGHRGGLEDEAPRSRAPGRP